MTKSGIGRQLKNKGEAEDYFLLLLSETITLEEFRYPLSVIRYLMSVIRYQVLVISDYSIV